MKLSHALKFHRVWLKNRHLPRSHQSIGTFARFDARGEDLTYAYLAYADLESANLESANLQEADLSKSTLVEADLSAARLVWTDLSEAKLSRANLASANLEFSNLKEADLSGANLSGVKLNKTKIHRANLSGANLGGIDWIQPGGWAKVFGWQSASWDNALGVIFTRFDDIAVLSYRNEYDISFLYSRPVVQENYMRHVVHDETLCFRSHSSFLRYKDDTKKMPVTIIQDHINRWSIDFASVGRQYIRDFGEEAIDEWIEIVKSSYSFIGEDQIKLILEAI